MWRYTYALSFIPIFNFVYLFLRRLTVHQMNLYAYLQSGDLQSSIACLASANTELDVNKPPTRTSNTIWTQIMGMIVNLFSVEPDLQRQIDYLEQIEQFRDQMDISEGPRGYRIVS